MSKPRSEHAPVAPPAPVSREAAVDRLVIDRLRWWDLDEVRSLELALFPEDPWTVGQFWSELARVPESRWYVVARRGSRLVGYAGVLLVLPEADIQTVAVAPAEQGRGTGRALLLELLERAGSRGASVVQLEVRAENTAALALYEGLGFIADGRRRDYYGRGRDALLMSLRLPRPSRRPTAGPLGRPAS